MVQCNVKLSARTVRRRLQEFGLKSRTPRKKATFISPNKEFGSSLTIGELQNYILWDYQKKLGPFPTDAYDVLTVV
ncbi:hypothetical protein L345_00549, partial [Ophiophagus hannah]